ncbi:MAG: hypothetical protein AB7C95_04715 [Synergistaceae bacterium]
MKLSNDQLLKDIQAGKEAEAAQPFFKRYFTISDKQISDRLAQCVSENELRTVQAIAVHRNIIEKEMDSAIKKMKEAQDIISKED